MLRDDVQPLVDFLRGTDTEELSDSATNETPPANKFYQTELATVIDRFAIASKKLKTETVLRCDVIFSWLGMNLSCV